MNTNQARQWQHQHEEQQTVTHEEQVFVKRKKIGWITKGEKTLIVLFCIAVICATYYIISYAATTDQLNRSVQTLEEDVNQMYITNDTLDYKVKELSKPERITAIAKEHGLKIQDTKVKRATK